MKLPGRQRQLRRPSATIAKLGFVRVMLQLKISERAELEVRWKAWPWPTPSGLCERHLASLPLNVLAVKLTSLWMLYSPPPLLRSASSAKLNERATLPSMMLWLMVARAF